MKIIAAVAFCAALSTGFAGIAAAKEHYRENSVKADFVVTIADVAAEPELRGACDAAGLAWGERRLAFEPGGAALDLDEREPPAADGD